jgi:hypothetical protein
VTRGSILCILYCRNIQRPTSLRARDTLVSTPVTLRFQNPFHPEGRCQSQSSVGRRHRWSAFVTANDQHPNPGTRHVQPASGHMARRTPQAGEAACVTGVLRDDPYQEEEEGTEPGTRD